MNEVVIKDLLPDKANDTVSQWGNIYLNYKVTTSESTRMVQIRDINCFIEYMKESISSELRSDWTPRLSREFRQYLQTAQNAQGQRRWSDRTCVRILAHLKTFSRFINDHVKFALGNPMDNITIRTKMVDLSIDRALTKAERNRILDAADQLQNTHYSKDRNRYKHIPVSQRKVHKRFRPLRNRALVYALIETGMRREAVTRITLDNIDFRNNIVKTMEKGNKEECYVISNDGLNAIQDYIDSEERSFDAGHFTDCPYLFLSSPGSNSKGKLSVKAVNRIWDDVCHVAGVEGKSPHTARHRMGKDIMEKTGSVAAVQSQLGHTNVGYSVQYSRVSNKEMLDIINNR